MKYYRDANNQVYAFESDGSQDDFIKVGLVRVSRTQAMQLACPPLSQDALIKQAEGEKQRLISEAAKAVLPLQDALDLDMATEEEVTQLKAWKKYRVLVNRVDCSTAPDIDWPEQPE